MSDDVVDVGAAIVTGGASLLVTEPRRERQAAEADAKKARRADTRIRNVKEARERRKAIREARIARAELQSGAQASGTTVTSSSESGVGGIGTQLASNLSFLDETSALADESSLFQAKSAKHARRAGEFEQVRNIAIQGASLFTGG